MMASRWTATTLALACTLLAAEVRDVQAQGTEKGAFGLGLILGEPTGVAAKLYLSDDTAVAAAVGGALVATGWHIHGDYLWHPWVLEDRDSFVMPAYVGGGARLLMSSQGDVHVGVRGVGGMLFDFKDIPIDVFVELALIVEYVFAADAFSGLGLGLNAGAGARYYF